MQLKFSWECVSSTGTGLDGVRAIVRLLHGTCNPPEPQHSSLFSFVPFCSAPSLVVRFQELLRFVSPMAEGEKDTLKGLEQVNILGIVGVGMM